MVKKVTTPLSDDCIKDLRAGDIVLLSGRILVARDAAHKRLVEAMQDGEAPFEVKDETIFYAGPAPTPPGAVIGPIGPTTSYRMDPYTPYLLEHGLKGMIGKGRRSPEVLEAIKKNTAVYFGATGGAGALIGLRGEWLGGATMGAGGWVMVCGSTGAPRAEGARFWRARRGLRGSGSA